MKSEDENEDGEEKKRPRWGNLDTLYTPPSPTTIVSSMFPTPPAHSTILTISPPHIYLSYSLPICNSSLD